MTQQERKKNNICRKCKQKREPGFSMCEYHLIKNNEWSQKSTKNLSKKCICGKTILNRSKTCKKCIPINSLKFSNSNKDFDWSLKDLENDFEGLIDF